MERAILLLWVYLDFCCLQTEVLVNSTDPMLQHKYGHVSASLLSKAGHGLVEECERAYPEGIGEEALVAVTDSYELKPVKKIFHVVLAQTDWSEAKVSAKCDKSSK